mmetsp:Transcript_26541/g.85869  ORF Transcript_26541/g.85869 Transcript_26541/m.85869 type:complete len:300 (-) Transcript_26541:402-1301(-)
MASDVFRAGRLVHVADDPEQGRPKGRRRQVVGGLLDLGPERRRRLVFFPPIVVAASLLLLLFPFCGCVRFARRRCWCRGVDVVLDEVGEVRRAADLPLELAEGLLLGGHLVVGGVESEFELPHELLELFRAEDHVEKGRRIHEVFVEVLLASLVVLRPRRGVRQHLVRRADLLKTLRGLGVVRVLIRMTLQRELVVGLLDLAVRRRRFHSQEVVVLRVLHFLLQGFGLRVLRRSSAAAAAQELLVFFPGFGEHRRRVLVEDVLGFDGQVVQDPLAVPFVPFLAARARLDGRRRRRDAFA